MVMNFSDYEWNNIRFIDVFKVTSQKSGSKSFAHGRRDIFQLGLKMSGTADITYNNQKYLFCADSVLYLPKETSPCIDYETLILEQGVSLCIFFDAVGKLPPTPILTQNINSHIRGLFCELHTFYNQNNKDLFACMSVFFNILSSLEKTSKPTLSKTIDFDNIISYMQNHISDTYIDFDMLAKENRISIDHFRHMFKKTYNVSPLQYFHNMKIDYIKTLMHNGKYSVNEIAVLSGFHDLNYFSRFFKKHMGMSPVQYRKLCIL